MFPPTNVLITSSADDIYICFVSVGFPLEVNPGVLEDEGRKGNILNLPLLSSPALVLR